jgi:hypothetical protein
MQARLLVALFWVIGMPLTILSFTAVPLAVRPGPLLERILWALVPVVGPGTLVLSARALLRLQRLRGGARFFLQWNGRYYVELLCAFLVYLATGALAELLVPQLADGTGRVLVSLAPTAGLALMIAAVVRWVRRADEYHRARLLESFAVTAGVTVLWTSGYAWLTAAGVPSPPIQWVPGLMVLVWALWSMGRAALSR